ncbi:MAG: UDP-N-acetylmuramoyl-L-alanine--D-glutamate ligase [Peptostreptococcaceae bacterium]|nr:UDP-N-acetylmuramoyl-L-alanine--D-glutamate ligase [Peptostreptococcaceae bacterium]
MKLKDKRVMVVGMALSGLEAAKYLLHHEAKVSIFDSKEESELKEAVDYLENIDVKVETGGNPESAEGFDLIVLSPGVSTELPFIKEAIASGVEVIGELELAGAVSRGKVIAITGTNGKTTTTALTGEIFKKAGKDVHVLGNIGIPAIIVSDLTNEESYLITEVSSFQLESIKSYKPATAAILNITPDHLNRHGSMDAYIAAKKRIFMNMIDGQIILNYDNDITRRIGKNIEVKGLEIIFFSTSEELENGVYVSNGEICINRFGLKKTVCRTDEIFIPGRHNLENALAAAAIADCHGIAMKTIRESLMTFEGVEHRIEFVEEIRGVKYYNDSKGTNPDASIKAIEAFDGPIVLIAGGMDKGSDFSMLIESFNMKVKEMIVLGETKEKIIAAAAENGFHDIFRVEDMESAVRRANAVAEKGDCVLLSPACASWDMYKSYEYRGKDFKDRVKELRD